MQCTKKLTFLKQRFNQNYFVLKVDGCISQLKDNYLKLAKLAKKCTLKSTWLW